MRISRVYSDSQLRADHRLHLSEETSHYLTHVLRLREGAALTVFNGADGEFVARVCGVQKNKVEVFLEKQCVKPDMPALSINLALGLSRGDRMDYAIQKSTELGVSKITPLHLQHGEVKLSADRVANKLNHWRKIAVSASEQSGRLDIPEISPPCTLADWLPTTTNGLNLLLDPSATMKIDDATRAAEINLLVGPEGGFSQQELACAQDHGFAIISLGPRVLRTETAPVAALAILQHLHGDM